MAKRRTDDYDIFSRFNDRELNILVVQRDSGRILASIGIPKDAADAFGDAVAESLRERNADPPTPSPPPTEKKKPTAKTTEKKTTARKSAKK